MGRKAQRILSIAQILLPVISAIPRRIVSTSGSSGKAFPRAVALCPTCLIRSGGVDRKTARMAAPKPANEPDGPTTHFGYATVPEAEKAGRVHGVFASVAGRYDLMNDAMSLGIHRLWKAAMIDWLAPRPGMRLLDVAGSTGDIAFRFLERLKGKGHATVLDMTEDMLAEGRRRDQRSRPRHGRGPRACSRRATTSCPGRAVRRAAHG